MALLQYKCAFCGKEFEELVKSHTDKVLCPDCGRPAGRAWSGVVYSATGKKCSSGSCSGNCSTCPGCSR